MASFITRVVAGVFLSLLLGVHSLWANLKPLTTDQEKLARVVDRCLWKDSLTSAEEEAILEATRIADMDALQSRLRKLAIAETVIHGLSMRAPVTHSFAPVELNGELDPGLMDNEYAKIVEIVKLIKARRAGDRSAATAPRVEYGTEELALYWEYSALPNSEAVEKLLVRIAAADIAGREEHRQVELLQSYWGDYETTLLSLLENPSTGPAAKPYALVLLLSATHTLFGDTANWLRLRKIYELYKDDSRPPVQRTANNFLLRMESPSNP